MRRLLMSSCPARCAKQASVQIEQSSTKWLAFGIVVDVSDLSGWVGLCCPVIIGAAPVQLRRIFYILSLLEFTLYWWATRSKP